MFFCALIFATFAPEILKRSTLTIILIVAKMKKVKALLTSFMMVFVANAMFAQTSTISITVNNGSKITDTTSQTFADILSSHSIAPSNVTSLTISGPMKDGDIATLRTLTNMTTLDMAGVTFVPDLYKEGDEIPEGKNVGDPKSPFITAVDSVWTTELGPIDQNAAVPHGITSATKLPSHIFDGMKKLTSVTIPTSVTTFGDYCFMGCEALTTVNNIDRDIDRVTDLGGHTFLWCTSLQSFEIPNDVTELHSTFMGCTALTSVTFPANLTTIAGAFARCINFNLINGAIPSTVRTIGDYAFFKCESLTKIVLPEAGLTSLGGFAFDYCSSLTEVVNFDKINLGETQVELDNHQFATVTQAIPSYLFKNCVNLETITFPNNIGAVGGYAFINCTKLNSTITLSEHLRYVGYEAFANCQNLEFVPQAGGTLLPSSLTTIANLAFVDCTKFVGPINYPSQDDNTIHHGVFWRTGVTGVNIPDGITTIEAHAFENTTFAESNKVLQIPASVTNIGVGAFANNPGITKVVIANGSNRDLFVDEWAFNNLANLEEVVFGDGLQNITLKYHAFSYNKKTNKVVIPAGANVMVGVESFVENDKLALVELGEGAKVIDIDRAGFAGCLTLPNAVANRLMQDLTEIKEAIFFNCESLYDIVIPSGVTKIDKDAFGGTISLKMITVSRSSAPETVTTGTRTWTNPDTHLEETIEVVTYPFGENTIPNQCMINFTGDAHNNIASYRANEEFLRLLTKTLDEDVTAVNWVNQEGANVILKRKMASKWNSVVLPFDCTQEQLVEAFGERTLAAEFTSSNAEKEAFRFTVRSGLSNNRPVLLKPAATTSTKTDYTIENVNIVNPSVVPYGDGNYSFTGIYAKTESVVPENSYVSYQNHFVTFDNNKNHSQAFRAWLQPVVYAGAPRFAQAMAIEIADEDGETTMIGNVQDFTDKQTDHAYYTLDGRRVENPTNGIYIVNGKKVVIK